METISQDLYVQSIPPPCYKDLVGYLPSGEKCGHAGILVCQHNTVRPKYMRILKKIFFRAKIQGQFRD
jgi:hypothetical protein